MTKEELNQRAENGVKWRKKEKMMSLNKSIANGSEHRKPYRKSKAVDRTCRNHGTCVFCRENRLYSARKILLKMTERGNEYETD
ncbi:MAG: hypothetical protein NC489_43975 [Ruminococcus flavefaciens]|nr:hypothetical protein [Ruminococcus flavefaciens]